MPTDQSTIFLTRLEASGLLTADQFRQARQLGQKYGADFRSLAKETVQRGWLTSYQASQVARNQGKGLVLGPYLLLEPRGEGGMGQVFKARHRVMDRVVALKVIRKEHLSHPDLIKRFHREIRAAAQLSHPNIVAAHDAGEFEKTHFFVMEYLEGDDLAHLVMKSGPLPVPQACEFVRQTAVGLQYAHERGLVHRDIKPQNLFLINGATIKILDLGLARLRGAGEATQTLTQEGSMMGTPDYLAPEQALNAHRVDIRADIYSLGCTMYFLLTGQPPFPGGTFAQKVVRHQQAEVPSITQSRPDVPPALAQALHKLLAKKPEQRFQTPAELVGALVPYCGRSTDTSGVPIKALASVNVAAVEALPTVPPMLTAVIQPHTSAVSTHTTPSRSRNRVLLVSAVASVVLVASIAIAYLLTLGVRSGPSGTSTTVNLPFLPNIVGEVRKIVVADGKTPATWQCGLSLSSDGTLAACAIGSTVYVRNLESDKEVAQLRGHNEGVASVAISPDGKQILTGSRDKTIRLWSIAAAKEVRKMEGPRDQVSAISFAGNGQHALSGSGDGVIALWDLATEKQLWQSEGVIVPSFRCAAITKNQNTVVTGGSYGSNADLSAWETGPPPAVKTRFRGHTANVNCLALSQDESRLISGSSDKTVRLWDFKDGREIRRFDGHSAMINGVSFSPDGTQAVSASDDGTIRLWGLPTTQTDKSTEKIIGELHRFEIKGKYILGVVFFPNGKHVLALVSDGTLQIWGFPN